MIVSQIYRTRIRTIITTLFIMVYGLAICSCGGKEQDKELEDDTENLLTHQSDSLIRVLSENGMKSYRFEASLMERYELAKEPYSEFRKGVKIETFKDSTEQVDGTLIADYAIYFERNMLWEAKGNVVAVNASGQILETQQLFWNQKTKKIYSNIDSKITQGGDVLVGVGFESDEDMEVWEFRRPRGRLAVDIEPNRDSTATATSATSATSATPSSPARAQSKKLESEKPKREDLKNVKSSNTEHLEAQQRDRISRRRSALPQQEMVRPVERDASFEKVEQLDEVQQKKEVE